MPSKAPPKAPVVSRPGPAGGWGSVRGIARVAVREHSDPGTLKTLMEQNRPKGFACVSCAWTKPAEAKLFEFCENGAKATLWETTPLRCTPDFFAQHTVSELRTWKDHDLEQQGRLTHPLRYDPASDRYLPCDWDEGFYKGNTARERIWKTRTGKAEFTVPGALQATGFDDTPLRFRLITMRSNDQFNTTIYGNSDRLRGIEESRDVLLINAADMERAGLLAGDLVALTSDADDGVHREVGGLTAVPFDLPDGCVGAYYPEVNPLVPLGHHDFASKTPAYKSVPVRIRKQPAPAG